MDVIHRIDELKNERGWSDYTLAEKSGLSSSTIANMHRRNTIPSIPTLESICDAFGITLAEFFTEDEEDDARISKRKVAGLLEDIKDIICEFEEQIGESNK